VVPESGESQTHCINYFYYPHATRFYGDTLERDQAVSDGYVLANRLGMDTFEFRHMTTFLYELYQAKLIGAQSEFPMDKIGSREFIQKFLKSIAMRQGIGDLLAEGTARAADQLKNGWEYCSKNFPAYGSALHAIIRKYPGVALLWSLDSRCPVIDQHLYVRISQTMPKDPAPYTLTLEDARKISMKLYGSDRAIDQSTFKYKARPVVYGQNRSMVSNILVVCDWVYPVFRSYAREDQMGDTSLESQLLGAVTGYELTEEELNQVGERVWNLGRAVMIREGRTREDDTLHKSFFQDAHGEEALSYPDFEMAKTEYYQLRGWDPKTGWPTTGTLHRLDLSEVAEGLKSDHGPDFPGKA
jgi:aldehyde:ferredoxin oxidoreductase